MAYSAKVMRYEVESLIDEDFIALVQRFDALQTQDEKLLFIMSNSSGGEGIIIPLTREIDGTAYTYGFNIQRAEEADRIALALHKIMKGRMFDYYLTTFPQRLALCTTERERVDLVEAELKEQTSFLDNGKIKEYALAYKFEKLKRDDLFAWCHVDLSDVMKYNLSFYTRISWTASGALVYKVETYLSNLLEELKGGASQKTKAKKHPAPPPQDHRLEDFIEPGLCGLYLEVEERLKDEVEAWKNKQGIKNECAGFCEAIFQKGWFWEVKPSQTTVNNATIRTFARWRYRWDIEQQLLAKRKANREIYRDRFLVRLEHWGY